MPDNRRHRVLGGTYFSTINVLDRHTDLLTRHIASPRFVRRRFPTFTC